MLDLVSLALLCAPAIDPTTLAHVVQVESNGNPFAIGVVGAHLQRQPRSAAEAIATAAWLEGHQFNYSVGLAQVNRSNFKAQGLTLATAFEPCRNLNAAGAILTACYLRAHRIHPSEQQALREAFSCYYSGHFTTRDTADYVMKVVDGTAHRSSTENSNPSTSLASVVAVNGQPRSALIF